PHPFDALFERVVGKMPQRWAPLLSKFHPKKFRRSQPLVDPASLQPTISAPAFIRVQKLTADSRTNWYNGQPFVTVELSLDTSRTGAFSGEVEVVLDRRKAVLPINFRVRERPPGLLRLLVASSPFECQATEDAA